MKYVEVSPSWRHERTLHSSCSSFPEQKQRQSHAAESTAEGCLLQTRKRACPRCLCAVRRPHQGIFDRWWCRCGLPAPGLHQPCQGGRLSECSLRKPSSEEEREEPSAWSRRRSNGRGGEKVVSRRDCVKMQGRDWLAHRPKHFMKPRARAFGRVASFTHRDARLRSRESRKHPSPTTQHPHTNENGIECERARRHRRTAPPSRPHRPSKHGNAVMHSLAYSPRRNEASDGLLFCRPPSDGHVSEMSWSGTGTGRWPDGRLLIH